MRYLLALLLIPSIALAIPADEQACYDKADSKEFTAPIVAPRYKVYRGLRRCRSWDCLLERVRPSRKVMQVVVAKNIPAAWARANWGNLGWARQNLALVKSESQIEAALLLARGIENYEIGHAADWIIEFALLDHDNYVWENKCIRRTKQCKRARRNGHSCITSFNEIQDIL